MSNRDEKLSGDLLDGVELAFAEHLETLRMALPNQEIEVVSKQGECVTVPNPLWIKLKTLKNKAASDLFRVMVAVDPQSMKGRKTDRTWAVIEKIKAFKGPSQGTA